MNLGQDQNQRDTQLKNQYSTFIEELQEDTEKLIDEVFNHPYQTSISDEDLQNKQKKKKGYTLRYGQRTNTDSFENFLKRTNKWVQDRQKNIERQIVRQSRALQSQLTLKPQILRGSRQKLAPIFERAEDIHREKYQKIAFKRIQQSKKQQKSIQMLPFHPQTNNNGPTRTINQYLADKQLWNSRKIQSINQLKVITQAKKYQQCIFTPILQTQKYNQRKKVHLGKGKVEDRLLKSLQRSVQKIRKMQI